MFKSACNSACTLGNAFFNESSIGPPKSSLFKSRNGPSFAGENGRKSRILDVTLPFASVTLLIAPFIQSELDVMMCLHDTLYYENTLVTMLYSRFFPF